MINLGVTLLMLGIGSFILPMMKMQFYLMQPLQQAQPVAGIVVSALGVLFIVLGAVRNNAKRARALAQAPVPQWPLYNPQMPPPPQQYAPLPGAMQTGHCIRCGHPLWAGDVVCRTCRLPANFGRQQPQPVQPVYVAPLPQPPRQQPPPPIAPRCPACGQVARPGKKFCAGCGTRLA